MAKLAEIQVRFRVRFQTPTYRQGTRRAVRMKDEEQLAWAAHDFRYKLERAFPSIRDLLVEPLVMVEDNNAS